jgi:hypothetical protein
MTRSYHLSPKKRREQSKRMKRLRADSVFEAKRLAARRRAVVERRRKRLGLAAVQT